MSATTVSPSRTTKRPVSVTLPMTVERSPHFLQMACAASRFSGVDDCDHALLRFAHHELERLHRVFAGGDLGDVDVDAHATSTRHLADASW